MTWGRQGKISVDKGYSAQYSLVPLLARIFANGISADLCARCPPECRADPAIRVSHLS